MKVQSNRFLQTATWRYAAAGAAFGLLFPVVATTISILEAQLPLSLASAVAVQRTQPLLWIIDTAPIFLGLFAALAGCREDRLIRANALQRELADQLKEQQEDEARKLIERTAQLHAERITERSFVTVSRRAAVSPLHTSVMRCKTGCRLQRTKPGVGILSSVQYYGDLTSRRVENMGITVSPLEHRRGRRLPMHVHCQAYFSMVLSGRYREESGRRAIEYDIMTIVYHPPGTAHVDEIADGGARFLTIEVDDGLVAGVARRQAARAYLGLSRTGQLNPTGQRRLGDHVYRMVQRLDAAATGPRSGRRP